MFSSLLRRWRLAAAAAASVARPFVPPPGFIDVRELIRTLSDEELMRSADEYFARMAPTSEQCRKPWGNPRDAVHQTRHLGLVLDAADLFRGAKVLDFGCATGWLTMGFAQMGCDALGVDIAPNAIRLADKLKATRAPAQGGGSLEYRVYDGHRLPVDDDSLDRIVCFDAFHHVRDQRATIQEFARVLKRGGRAAFMEPGPNHSKQPQSQEEMARFKVIENDVSMEEITRIAVETGFDKPRLLVQFPQPFTVEADDFNAWARNGIPRRWTDNAIGQLEKQLTNGQCFYLVKQGPPDGVPDSRRPEGLKAHIEVLDASFRPASAGHGIRLALRLHNRGTARWLTASGAGQVNLGVQVVDAQGRLVDDNFGRLRLGPESVEPGQSVEVSGVLRVPELAGFQLRLDLVSELVAWFSSRDGASAVVVRPAPAAPPNAR